MAKTPHTLVVLVENKAGVLARVAGLFARRGFNIESLAVAPTPDERFSRITFVVDVASAPLDQVIKQLDRFEDSVVVNVAGRSVWKGDSYRMKMRRGAISLQMGGCQQPFTL